MPVPAASAVAHRTVGLDEVPDGYRAMADREALKVLITP
jgi:threonine dehydrogenase-like Zn-dependent dehydrogenase